jgi:hypothetical protein
MTNEPNIVAPLSEEERGQLAERAALDFGPWESLANIQMPFVVKDIKAQGNTLVFAIALTKLAKTELIEKFVLLAKDDAFGDDETPPDIRMIEELEAAQVFYETASSVIKSALARMMVVNATILLRLLNERERAAS